MEIVSDMPQLIDGQYHSCRRSGKSSRGSIAFSMIGLQLPSKHQAVYVKAYVCRGELQSCTGTMRISYESHWYILTSCEHFIDSSWMHDPSSLPKHHIFSQGGAERLIRDVQYVLAYL